MTGAFDPVAGTQRMAKPIILAIDDEPEVLKMRSSATFAIISTPNTAS